MAGTPAGPKVTGAVALYAGVGPGRAMMGLGYGRESPRVQRKIGWVPFFTDLGGPVISFDELFASEEFLVSVSLNYYRADALGLVEAVAPGGVSLTSPFGSVGALAIFEGLTYPLAMVFPFFAKPAYRAAGLPPGVRFYAAKVESTVSSAGTLPVEVNLIWKCKAVYQPLTGAFISGDRNVAGLPPVII